MYTPVARSEVLDALAHIRDLHRKSSGQKRETEIAVERRELAFKHLASNLPRTSAHPTLRIVSEIAELFSLTVEGAHRLFGYDLTRIGPLDLRLNHGRTHIVESNAFDRDQRVELPLQFASAEAFRANRVLRDLVQQWQLDVPVRALQAPDWHQPGSFYVHVGTEDSLGSSLPPGSLALVEPIQHNEQPIPNPRAIYLLQFSNGYRCCRCVVSRGRLQLLSSDFTYRGPQEFLCPGAVRIAGRVRMFALALPLPRLRSLESFPPCDGCASLILPWEHSSRAALLMAKHKRFQRSKTEEAAVREHLLAILGTGPSARTERRYRKNTPSDPHVNSLLHFTLQSYARYSDALQTSGVELSDHGRFSLDVLLRAQRWEDAVRARAEARVPEPLAVWQGLRREFLEWPPMLSLKFPELSLLSDRVVRLGDAESLDGLEPPIAPGSWMLLEKTPPALDERALRHETGWSRPIYTLQRGVELFCGFLRAESPGYALTATPHGRAVKALFASDEVRNLRRVIGVAVPV